MLQEKKAHLINSTVNNDNVAFEKLTPQDMQVSLDLSFFLSETNLTNTLIQFLFKG